MYETPTTAHSYKNISIEDLRKLCAFKDGTIEILRDTLTHRWAQLETARDERDHYQRLFNDLRHDNNRSQA